MSQSDKVPGKSSRLSRRAVLRAGGAVAAGAGLAVGTAAPALGRPKATAQAGPWQTMHLEVDDVVVDPVSIVRAGSGPPQRGDSFFVEAQIYEAGKTDGPQIGTYQCFGAWTHASTDTNAPEQRLTTVQFRLQDRGTIVGVINEAGADPSNLVGVVQGGSGDFTGALGTFRQQLLSGSAVPGVIPGQTVFRGIFDLILPTMS